MTIFIFYRCCFCAFIGNPLALLFRYFDFPVFLNFVIRDATTFETRTATYLLKLSQPRCFVYRVGQKMGPNTHDHNSVNSEPIYNFFTRRFLVTL